jgi:hypothetical protein
MWMPGGEMMIATPVCLPAPPVKIARHVPIVDTPEISNVALGPVAEIAVTLATPAAQSSLSTTVPVKLD